MGDSACRGDIGLEFSEKLMDKAALADLKQEEGCNTDDDGYHVPYQDSLGIWTVGYGRNIQTAKFTELEATRWLHEDYTRAATLAEQIPEFKALSRNRKRVLIAMVYQLGLTGVMQFRKMRMAIRHGNWNTAGQEMLKSKWASQTPARAKRMAARMARNSWPE